MRYAIISDIHGNLEALQAVLLDIGTQSIDHLLCLGDIVGYYPDPDECCRLVQENVKISVAGNHDFAAIGRIDTNNFTYYAFTAMEWTKQHLNSASLAYLRSLPLTYEIDSMFLTHSSPTSPSDWIYLFPDSEDVVFETFNNLIYRINFIGHTHWPSIMIQDKGKIVLSNQHSIALKEDQFYLINAGSVGQPRDFDHRSSYAIYDTGAATISMHRVEYDYFKTQKKILDNNLPYFLAERLEKGR